MRLVKNLTLLLLFLLAMANVAGHYYFADELMRERLFNSDVLYLPTIISDVLYQGAGINDWYLTPAPYFFPDFVIFLLAFVIGKDVYTQIILFSLIQISVTLVAVWMLARVTDNPKPFVAAAAALIALIWLALSNREPFVLMYSSAFHYGVFINEIFVLCIFLYFDRISTNWLKIFLYYILGAICFVSALSDSLFLIQLVAPLIVACILFGNINLKPRFLKNHLVQLCIIFIGGAVGNLSYNYIVTNPTRYQASLGFAKFHQNITLISDSIVNLVLSSGIYATFLFFYGLIVIYAFVCLARGRFSNRILIWFVLYSFVCVCINAFAFLFVANISLGVRYLIPLFAWPIIVTIFFIGNHISSFFFICASIISLVLSIFLTHGTYDLYVKNGLNKDYYPDEISCIDRAVNKYHVKNGIAQYWDAKHVQAFSLYNLKLAQVDNNLREHHWITSKKYFRDSYDFAIISEKADRPYRISVDGLLSLNGQPSAVEKCGSKTLYIYNKRGLFLKKFQKNGDSYTWTGCELPTEIGQEGVECSMTKSDINHSGFLTLGPSEQLPVGNYDFEILYRSDAGNNFPIGKWDVVALLPTGYLDIVSQPVYGTAGIPKMVSLKFKVANNMPIIDIRTFAYKSFDFEVMRIKLIRN